MDVEIFNKEIRDTAANLISKEFQDLDLAKEKTTTWIQCEVEDRGWGGNIIRVDMVKKAFNSWMIEVFQGSDLGKIIEEMFAHIEKCKPEIRHWPTVSLCFIESYSWISIFIH